LKLADLKAYRLQSGKLYLRKRMLMMPSGNLVTLEMVIVVEMRMTLRHRCERKYSRSEQGCLNLRELVLAIRRKVCDVPIYTRAFPSLICAGVL